MRSISHNLRRRWKGERSDAEVVKGEVGKDNSFKDEVESKSGLFYHNGIIKPKRVVETHLFYSSRFSF